jgi:phosphate transport system permease protein
VATTSHALPGTGRRRTSTVVFRLCTYGALLLIVVLSAWMLIGVVGRAIPHFSWSVLYTTSEGTTGGLLNAILGTLLLMAGVLVIAGSIGVMHGIHMAELSKPKNNGKMGPVNAFLRSVTEILAGFPSIVLGYVGYVALVVGLHWGFSLLPALLILSMMVIPYIAKSTDTALRSVPTNYREGAEALGMSTSYSMRKVVLKTAFPGIVTGLLLALAIAGGETAPLLYTAGWSNSVPTLQLTHSPVGYLTYPIWTWYDLPQKQANYLAYDAALIVVVLILVLLVAARLVVSRSQRHAEGRAA